MIVRSLWKGEIEARPTAKAIAIQVADRHGLTLEDLRGPCRRREVAWPRQEAMAAVYANCRVSLPWVGRFFGNRDHTTVLHAIRRVAERRGAA